MHVSRSQEDEAVAWRGCRCKTQSARETRHSQRGMAVADANLILIIVATSEAGSQLRQMGFAPAGCAKPPGQVSYFWISFPCWADARHRPFCAGAAPPHPSNHQSIRLAFWAGLRWLRATVRLPPKADSKNAATVKNDRKDPATAERRWDYDFRIRCSAVPSLERFTVSRKRRTTPPLVRRNS